MESYISIKGKKTILTDAQLKELGFLPRNRSVLPSPSWRKPYSPRGV